jgi:hypothetical protein
MRELQTRKERTQNNCNQKKEGAYPDHLNDSDLFRVVINSI